MIKTIVSGCLLLLTTIAFSASKIGAVSSGEQTYPLNSHTMIRDVAANRPLKGNYFPETYYTVKNIRLVHLTWIHGKESTRQLLAPEECVISTSASLDLDTYDEKTGRYRYKFTITPEYILDYKMAMASGIKKVPIKPVGRAIFQANNKPFMYVEGIATFHAGKLTLSSIHTNRDNSSFELITLEQNRFAFVNLVDTPVIVELND